MDYRDSQIPMVIEELVITDFSRSRGLLVFVQTTVNDMKNNLLQSWKNNGSWIL